MKKNITTATHNTHQQAPILKDFQMLLDFIGSDGELVSKKQLVFSAKNLLELNLLMSKPIAHNKTRPNQTSLPHIAVVYDCALQLGFFKYTDKGSRKQINLNEAALESWNSLNPTEQYFTLLDRWLFGGEEDRAFSVPINRIEAFKRRSLNQLDSYYQNIFTHEYKMGGLLAGLELFGLVNIEHAKPDESGGWKINSLTLTEFGNFIFNILIEKDAQGTFLDSLLEVTIKPIDFTNFELFQPYFPDLQNTYQLKSQTAKRSGAYIFRISLRRVWRRIAVEDSLTLEELADVILQAFEFNNDHLHSFNFIDTSGQKREYGHPACEDEFTTDEIILSELPLCIKGSMKFIFDFGDWWEFTIKLEDIDSEYEFKDELAEILEGKGKAPEQYPDWDEEDM